MTDIALHAGTDLSPILDVARAAPPPAEPALQALVRQSGRSVGANVRAYARLAFGPGKLSFADFVRLRLFDPAFHGGADPATYVGQRRNRDLCVTVNHRHDWLGLLSNKVAALSYLGAYGFPTIPVLGLYAPQVATGAPTLLPDRAALGAFLMRPEAYPLFGKPVESFQSLGSIGLVACDPVARTLLRSDGRAVALDAFMDEITTHYPAGYLFQPLAVPHPEIDRICGRLATARIVTMLTGDGPRVFRAAWKLPVGGNVADNFWRPGNLLAGLDRETGAITRVVTGTGVDAVPVEAHPDTGVAFAGVRHPLWDAMRALAIDAARVMRHVPMIGWDIACTADGPVIVEMNETPDFFLVQFAEGRGVLDAEFADFVAHQRRVAADHLAASKAAIARM